MTFYILLITLFFEISNKISKKIIISKNFFISNSNSNRETIYFSLIFLYIDIYYKITNHIDVGLVITSLGARFSVLS